jgi:hypothetical protein
MEIAEKRGELILLLERALEMTEELEDHTTGYIITMALDSARAEQFRLSRKD